MLVSYLSSIALSSITESNQYKVKKHSLHCLYMCVYQIEVYKCINFAKESSVKSQDLPYADSPMERTEDISVPAFSSSHGKKSAQSSSVHDGACRN